MKRCFAFLYAIAWLADALPRLQQFEFHVFFVNAGDDMMSWVEIITFSAAILMFFLVTLAI